MNKYTFSFYLKDYKHPVVVTTKAKTYDEAANTLQRYVNGCFYGQYAPYSARLMSTEAVK